MIALCDLLSVSPHGDKHLKGHHTMNTNTLNPPASAASNSYTIAAALRTWDKQDFLTAVRYGLYDDHDHIPSYESFDGQYRRKIAERFNIDFNSTYKSVDDSGLKAVYKAYVVGRFNRRGVIPDRIWKIMDKSIKRAVAQSTRGKLAGVTSLTPSLRHVPELRINADGDPIIRHFHK